MLKVLGGSSAKHIAFEVSKEMEIDYIMLENKNFPDGEKYIRILDDDIYGNSYIVVQSMYKTPDEYLMEYFFIVNTLKKNGAKEIISFIPYFAYARQDKAFNTGEPVSFRIVADLIENAGTDKLFTFDPHLHRIKSLSDLFSIPAYNVSLLPTIARYIKDNYFDDDAVIIGPDAESEQWTSMAAEETGLEYDVLEKVRHGDYDIEIKPRELDIYDRDIILLDDIISTGGTMAGTIKMLKKQGVHKIIAATSHPLLIGDALINLYRAGADAVIGSDSIPSPVSFIKCAPVISEILRKM
ncbi:MAG: ribose-phosphate diphosphokinase [Promethearchaeota archaeon]|nr:MAG: ribose-phosphate diphosphokinase [Candidatus Lokiarchaeota archaeon]